MFRSHMSYVMHFCTNRFHFLYYCLLLVLRTFAEDTDFLSFPRPELILFPTVENLGFSAGFSLVRTPDCFFVWPGPTPWWRRFMVDLKEGCTSTSRYVWLLLTCTWKIWVGMRTVVSEGLTRWLNVSGSSSLAFLRSEESALSLIARASCRSPA